MFTQKFIYLVVLIIGLTSLNAHGASHYYSTINEKDGTQVEVFSTTIDTDNINSEENKEVVAAFKEQLGAGDAPIIVEALSEAQQKALGIEGPSIADIEHFLEELKLNQPTALKAVSDDAAKYFATGEVSDKLRDLYVEEFVSSYKFDNPTADTKMIEKAASFFLDSNFPEDKKAALIESLKVKDWASTDKAIASYQLNTKVEGIAAKLPVVKKFSKSALTLTLIRTIFNGAVSSAVTYASTGHVMTSLAYGTFSAAMTASIQLNSKFFEKLMTGKFPLMKFWLVECVVVGALLGASHLLHIPTESFLLSSFLLHDVAVMGSLTVATQGTSEMFASKQGASAKTRLSNEIIRLAENKELSYAEKKLVMSRLMAEYASATVDFSTTMVVGSMIWATSAAFKAALPAEFRDIAVYSTFGVLGAYSAAIGVFGINNVLNVVVKKPLLGFKNVIKQIGNLKKNVVKGLTSAFCNNKFKKS